MTTLLFFENTYQFDSPATITELIELNAEMKKILRLEDSATHALVLDQTVFYPQGGGQPSDLGVITTEDGSQFQVEMVKFTIGQVWHMGHFVDSSSSWEAGQSVQLQIDEDRRRLNARLHSAGHMIDVALENIGLQLNPTKGFHFPAGPYVEYEGTIEAEDREPTRQKLEEELNRLIKAGGPVTKEEVPYEKLEEICGSCPPYLPEGKPSRIVTMSNSACPCGGTHVEYLSEIGQVQIVKLSSKKGKVRVRYVLD